MSATTVHKPKELLFFEALGKRKSLTAREKRYVTNLEKGYEGELVFSRFMEQLKDDYIILKDLFLEYNHSTFQIDCLLITRNKIYLYEVKNFEGNYYLEGDKFYKKPRKEIINPFHQLSRTESILRQLLLNIGSNTPIESFVVFVNSTFMLYQSPLEIPAIFLNQIERHITFIKNEAGSVTDARRRLANKLVELTKTGSPYRNLPEIEYVELSKGVFCTACETPTMNLVKRAFVCEGCSYKETVTSAVLRSVDEFQLLFPEDKITTPQIYNWCGKLVSKKVIHRILSTNFQSVGKKRWTYYV